MDTETRRTRSWNLAVAVMDEIRKIIDEDDGISRSEAAKHAGVPVSTFYRWLDTPPNKIDVAVIAAVADWLHDAHGYEDFATLWKRVKRSQT